MKLAAAAVLVAAALVLPAAQAAERKTASPVLGLDFGHAGSVLAWVDPFTLAKLQRPQVSLGGSAGSWSFSPDRSTLAIGAAETTGASVRAEFKLRFVSVGEMRVIDELDLGEPQFEDVTWLRPDRLLALVRADSPRIVVVDPSRRVVLRSVSLPRTAGPVARLPDGLALLLGSDGPFAPAELAVVDADGALRSVTLDRISVGTVGHEERVPGFAVDRARGRAFVVGTDLTVAEVNLDTLAVKYHGGRTRALAKAPAGAVRQALWLGHGLLAVSGADRSWATAATQPVGLRLMDTRNWRTRIADRWIDHIERVPGNSIFLASSASAAPWRIDVYGLRGKRRYRLDLNGSQLWMQGPYGYVCESSTVIRIVSASGGRTLRVPASPRPACPYLLYGQSL